LAWQKDGTENQLNVITATTRLGALTLLHHLDAHHVNLHFVGIDVSAEYSRVITRGGRKWIGQDLFLRACQQAIKAKSRAPFQSAASVKN
jgi:hypothetical protein